MAARSLLTRSLVALPLAGALAFGTVSSASAAWSVKVTDGTGAKGQVCKTRPVGGTVTVRYRLDNRRGSELRLGGFYLVKHGEPWFGAGSVTTKARKGAVSKVIRKRYPDADIVITADNDRFTVQPVGEPRLAFRARGGRGHRRSRRLAGV